MRMRASNGLYSVCLWATCSSAQSPHSKAFWLNRLHGCFQTDSDKNSHYGPRRPLITYSVFNGLPRVLYLCKRVLYVKLSDSCVYWVNVRWCCLLVSCPCSLSIPMCVSGTFHRAYATWRTKWRKWSVCTRWEKLDSINWCELSFDVSEDDILLLQQWYNERVTKT